MRRNFGSLDLAALDLHSPFQDSDASLEDRFSALDTGGDDCSTSEYSSSDDSGCVGFPLERLQMPQPSMHSAPQSLQDVVPQDMELDDDAMPELALPPRSQPSRPRSESGDDRPSRVLQSMSDIPQHLQEQHHAELNALRCLSLKVMLSNLSTSSDTVSKPSYAAYPGVNDRSKTALLPIRQPSMQSV